MPGTILNITNSQIVERAKSCLHDTNTKYRLNYPNGGSDPTKPKPYDKVEINGHVFEVADCIGFAMWCAGISRRFTGTSNIPAFPDTPSISGSYINCASLVEEAEGFPRRSTQPPYKGGRFFKIVQTPEPGDFIVFKGKGGKHGHIGIISRVPVEAPLDPTKVDNWIVPGPKKLSMPVTNLRIIHCSPYCEKHFFRPIAETDATIWRGRDAKFVKLNRQELLNGVFR